MLVEIGTRNDQRILDHLTRRARKQPIEATIDHTGPMTATVSDNALMLEVLAGADGLDPRQYAPKVAPYTEALKGSAKGLKIGIVKEGFGHPSSEADVDAKASDGRTALYWAARNGHEAVVRLLKTSSHPPY